MYIFKCNVGRHDFFELCFTVCRREDDLQKKNHGYVRILVCVCEIYTFYHDERI